MLSLPCVASGVMKTNMSAKLVALVSDKQSESPKDESSSSVPENLDRRHHDTDNKAIFDYLKLSRMSTPQQLVVATGSVGCDDGMQSLDEVVHKTMCASVYELQFEHSLVTLVSHKRHNEEP